MTATPKKKHIDIEEVIRSKNPRLLKVLPRFLKNYLKKVLHENDMNLFLDEHGDRTGMDFGNKVLQEMGVMVHVKGLENIPSSGGLVVASNHPLGGLDALALLQMLSKKRTDFKFIVNDILTQFKNLQDLFIGVNKHGTTAVQSLAEIDKQYASESVTLIFPAGLVSRKQKGVVRDLEWKKSFITKAKKHKRNIMPVFIEASNSKGFYNLAMWRKRFGIKANIEMLYLIDEMYRQKNKSITIVFGKVLPYELFDKQHTDMEWAQKMKEHVYAIASNDKTKMIG